MTPMQTHKFKLTILNFIVFSLVAFAQKETKNFTETFKVNSDVEVDINTSYADIKFETWNKNTVEVEAIIEVEGLSKEEAEEYFKSWNFEAVGNSTKVSVTTKPMHWSSQNRDITLVSDFDFDFVNIVPAEVVIPEIPPLPPLPPLPVNFENFSFDYEAYKQDGDKYLESWKKSFNENFKADLDQWKQEVEKQREFVQLHKKEIEEYRNEIRQQRIEKMQVQRAAMKEVGEARKKAMQEQRNAIKNSINQAQEARREAMDEFKKNSSKPNVFYYSSAANKKLKVKKTIKIKMPKKAKIKMNVRHGEVTLADKYENINAILSHTRFMAVVIDGENSVIEASYSPVKVETWNYGELKVNYVKEVDLKNVKSMKLISRSSDVVIGTISEDAILNNSFGNLNINNVQEGFKRLEIILDNSDATLFLPQSVAYDFHCSSTDSKVKYPKSLNLDVTKKYSNQLAKGYNIRDDNNKSVSIVATLSNVKIE